jgi:hypothetical protein
MYNRERAHDLEATLVAADQTVDAELRAKLDELTTEYRRGDTLGQEDSRSQSGSHS